MVDDYGLVLPAFMIENISLPEEVEAAMDKRTSIGVAGDLSRYTEFSAAEALTRAAGNPGGGGDGLTAGVGMGMGMAMAERMARRGPWGDAPVAGAAPPPLPPAAARWHVASQGKASGPFTEAELRHMAAEGTLAAASQVWSPGSEGWRRAAEVPELAAILGQVPPPLPPEG
jgi:hypothetical protein